MKTAYALLFLFVLSLTNLSFADSSDGPSGMTDAVATVAQDKLPAISNPSVVMPDASPFYGGIEVTISGTALGNGSDITNVTLCGSSAAIVWQSATQLL